MISDAEQSFRLSYITGDWDDQTTTTETDDFDFGEEDNDRLLPAGDVQVADKERLENMHRLVKRVAAIRSLAETVGTDITKTLGPLKEQKKRADKDAWNEIFSESAKQNAGFGELVDEILKEIKQRVDAVERGSFEFDDSGWPLIWTFSEHRRDEFLKQVRIFTSNHYTQFGKLLTPIVESVRILWQLEGKRTNMSSGEKLVLIDGQGLGHSEKTATSISTNISDRFGDVDMILLVDNAEQPMLTAPIALLRAAITSGYTHKLAVAFTHFDLVTGPNFRTQQHRREHVMNAVRTAAQILREECGDVSDALESQIDKHAFLLGALDKEMSKIPGGVKNVIADMLQKMQDSMKVSLDVNAAPRYSSEGLDLALQAATDKFKKDWRVKLGIENEWPPRKEHWGRIKALNRRFAEEWENTEYFDLRPIADLEQQIKNVVSKWLDDPNGWIIAPNNDDERRAVIDKVRGGVNDPLSKDIKQYLAETELDAWELAYEHHGYGSTKIRAQDIDELFERAAPEIGYPMSDNADRFSSAIREIIQDAVEGIGGTFNEADHP